MSDWLAVLERPAPDTRDPAAAAAAVRALLGTEIAGLPLPGGGDTRTRLRGLRAISRWDVVVGRLVEAHLDAVAILAEIDPAGPGVQPGEWWGVWAAEPPGPGVTAYPATDGTAGWQLRGRKQWCPGAGGCTHALVTAATADGRRQLFAMATGGPGVQVVPGGWQAAGMAGSDTRTVDLTGAPARAVGAPGAYLDRPGFWPGTVGVAACWLGGTEAVLDRLVAAGSGGRLDPHAAAHLGAGEAAVYAAAATLDAAALDIDTDPLDQAGIGRLLALRARAVVERAATEVIDRVGRALGPAPLVQDAAHARRVADLQISLRQSHADRDLATLGELVAALPRTGGRV